MFVLCIHKVALVDRNTSNTKQYREIKVTLIMIHILPTEVLILILQHLPLVQTLKTLRQICKDWKNAIDNSGLMVNLCLVINHSNWKERLNSNIFYLVGELKLELFWRNEIKSMNKILNLIETRSYNQLTTTDLSLHSLNLSNQQFEAKKLTPLFSKLTKINISNSTILNDDWETIFSSILSAVTNDSLTIKSLLLHGNDKMAKVCPNLFSTAVCSLTEVHMKLALDQSKVLFEYIIENHGNIMLKNLNLRHSFLGSSDPQLLAEAVCRVETVNLYGTRLKETHLQAIYKAISTCDQLVLENLDLIQVTSKLGNIDEQVFAKAVIKLNNFKGDGNKNLVFSLFEKIVATTDCKLESVSIPTSDCGEYELGTYPPNKLQIVKKKLIKCDIDYIHSRPELTKYFPINYY